MADGSLFSQRLDQQAFDRIRAEVYKYCGINITPVKKQMVEGRLRSRLRALGLATYGEYCSLVFSGKGYNDEFHHLIDVITTNKTEFFREPAHFDYLRERYLPGLYSSGRYPSLKPLRVWSSACSTGQEPYTLAMILAAFQAQYRGFEFYILATDICSRVLETARRAIYPMELAEPIPYEYKKNFLLKSRNRQRMEVRIVPGLRKLVHFKRLNLNDRDYDVKPKMDIIFCRNVIIYFDARTQETILRRLALTLRPKGLLFLGHSESIHGMDLPVRQLSPTIYERV